MPKLKTKSAVKKRFKLTASGKVIASQAGKNILCVVVLKLKFVTLEELQYFVLKTDIILKNIFYRTV